MSEVLIYGAGQAGLIAAINLAKDGYDVLVRDAEPGYGGSSLYNPSTHTTPINVEKTSEYLGIDISPAFHPLLVCPFYFHDLPLYAPLDALEELYTVERGNRETSLDTLLYKQAQELGVKFEFSTPLKGEDIPNLPKNTIIACGLIAKAYEIMEIPMQRWYGWISRGEIAFSGKSWIWFDECITEYGYLSSVNNYYFNLLFSRRPIEKQGFEKYKEFMIRNEGIEHDNWEYVSGVVPVADPKNPRLYQGNAIMCGTMSGMMDPFFWFGILGALISGKIAALAITDPAKAEADFKRFNRRFPLMYNFKINVWDRFLRPNVSMMEAGVRTIGPKRLESIMRAQLNMGLPMPGAIPGYTKVMGCY